MNKEELDKINDLYDHIEQEKEKRECLLKIKDDINNDLTITNYKGNVFYKFNNAYKNILIDIVCKDLEKDIHYNESRLNFIKTNNI